MQDFSRNTTAPRIYGLFYRCIDGRYEWSITGIVWRPLDVDSVAPETMSLIRATLSVTER